jgi:hypothetical protein
MSFRGSEETRRFLGVRLRHGPFWGWKRKECDRRPAQVSNLASNVYLKEQIIRQNCAMVILPQLITLDESVTGYVRTDELPNEFLMCFNRFVSTERRPSSKICRIAAFCHANKIQWILYESRGVFGYVFVDLGDKSVAIHLSGEEPSRFLLAFIGRDEKTIVTIAKPEDGGEEHHLSPGDYMQFEQVERMTALTAQSSEVELVKRLQFRIKCDTRYFPEDASVSRSCHGNQEFQSKTSSFLPFVKGSKEASRRHVTFD